MSEYEYTTVHAKWGEGTPPEPDHPYGDKSWQLVAATSWGNSVSFYWRKEVEPGKTWHTCPECGMQHERPLVNPRETSK